MLLLAYSHSRLPVELYRPIVEAVSDRAVLLALTAACSLLRAEAERVLYQTIELDPEHEPRFCEFFSQSALRIARHVRKCSLFLPGAQATLEYFEEFAHRRSTSSKRASTTTITGASLTTCIPLMKNLRTLSVSGHVGGLKFGKVLRGSRLSLNSFASTSPLDKTTLEFLESQPHITELTTLHSKLSSLLPGRSALSAKALPNLSVIRALTPRIATDLAPRRPVTHVETYVWGGDSCARVASRLALSRGPLRALLVIQGFKLRVRDIDDLAQHLPSLEYMGECHLVDSVTACTKALAQLKSLRTLVLSLQSIPAHVTLFDVVLQLSRACHSLHTIVFTIALMPRQMWVRSPYSGRWEQVTRPAQSVCCTLWAAA